MRISFTILTIILYHSIFAQVQVSPNFILAQEFSKEISLYKAKSFLLKEVLNPSQNDVQFEIDPLAASSSGELTSLVYRCESQNLEGLILGFYGNFWNESGVVYKGYAFLNFPKAKALELLQKISETIERQSSFLSSDYDNNNIFFKYDDLYFLITKNMELSIRVFWNDFDAEWTATAFNRTKKRFEKSIK
jgi:hypothetical protein